MHLHYFGEHVVNGLTISATSNIFFFIRRVIKITMGYLIIYIIN